MAPQLNLQAYEQALRGRAKEYERALADFERALNRDDLAQSDVEQSLGDLQCFLNEYLLHEDDNTLEMGCYLVDDFMEEYFIANCSLPSADAVEHMCKSLEHFYSLMLNAGSVDEDAYDELVATIEAQQTAWKDSYRQHASRQHAEHQHAEHQHAARAEDSSAAADMIDSLVLSLVLLSAQSGRTWDDICGASIARLQLNGFITCDANGNPTGLTPLGVVRAQL